MIVYIFYNLPLSTQNQNLYSKNEAKCKANTNWTRENDSKWKNSTAGLCILTTKALGKLEEHEHEALGRPIVPGYNQLRGGRCNPNCCACNVHSPNQQRATWRDSCRLSTTLYTLSPHIQVSLQHPTFVRYSLSNPRAVRSTAAMVQAEARLWMKRPPCEMDVQLGLSVSWIWTVGLHFFNCHLIKIKDSTLQLPTTLLIPFFFKCI